MRTIRNYSCSVSFLDLLFNMLLAFTALFVLAFVMISVKKDDSKSNAEVKAEYIINISWPEELDYDVDVYVEDPMGNLVCFRRREEGLMHLERDDLGHRNDTVQTPGGPQKFNVNRESVTLRGLHSGEYVVNAHAYRVAQGARVPVTVTVDRINPKFETVLLNNVKLIGMGDERTLVRFTLDKSGDLVSKSTLFKPLVVPKKD